MPPVRIDAANFSPDTRAFLEALAEKGVQYLIVGGEAVILHARSHDLIRRGLPRSHPL